MTEGEEEDATDRPSGFASERRQVERIWRKERRRRTRRRMGIRPTRRLPGDGRAERR